MADPKLAHPANVPGEFFVDTNCINCPTCRQIAPAIFGMPIHVPPPDEYVALGAARQAAWALSGAMNPPTWITGDSQLFTATPTPGARTRYAKLRDATTHWEW